MNLKNLNSQQLNTKMKLFFDQENKLNHDILLHLVEVDRRRLYLEMAYPSLFEYLTLGIGFSAASAQRRIDAARLMRQIPEVADQINAGAVSMVQISKIQAASRLLKKRGSVVTLENKKSLLNEVQNKTVRETELIIAQRLDLPVITLEKSIRQKDESVRMEITFTKDEIEKIESAKALLSHSLGDGSFKDMVLYLADRVIVQKTKLKDRRNETNSPAGPISSEKAYVTDSDFKREADVLKREKRNIKNSKFNSTITTKVKPISTYQPGVPSQQKNVSAKIKKIIFNRDRCCQYQDPLSGKKCGSQYFLEVDHIKPRWISGSHVQDNLRILCSSHNKYRYQMGR